MCVFKVCVFGHVVHIIFVSHILDFFVNDNLFSCSDIIILNCVITDAGRMFVCLA